MKKVVILAFSILLFIACGKNRSKGREDFSKSGTATTVSDYDPKRGEGKFDKVALNPTLDLPMAKAGEEVSEVKCLSCHKITDERLVGPGWKDVTKRRTPEWLMNFITNPDPMIDKDPELQAQLEVCLIRMPNQGLTDDEARSVLEYMRKIDGV